MRIALAALVCLFVGAPAHAMYIPPDIVEVPAERLIRNLEAKLTTQPEEERHHTLLQLARLHAAAWAKRADSVSVVNPTTMTMLPAKVKGPHTGDDVSEAIAAVVGWGGNFFLLLREPRATDGRHGCDARAVARLEPFSGKVVLRFDLAKGKEGAVVAPSRVQARASTQQGKLVGACIVARIAEDVRFPAKGRKSSVELEFHFESKEGVEPYLGFGDYTVPERIAPESADATAEAHLAKARAHYEQLVALQPDSALAHLGLAWTLEQAGQLDTALAAYRKAFAEGWARESSLQSIDLGKRPIAREAAAFLLPRLDAERDAAEIAEIEKALAYFNGLLRLVTPIVVPLASQAQLSEALSPDSEVRFDLDGSGQARQWGWVAPDAALLVWDPSGDGAIASGLQLLGSVTWWTFWRDGYDALAALDDNGDGVLSGSELEGLALWRDQDGDGIAAPGEVLPLSAHGVVALATRGEDVDGVLTAPSGVVFADGTTRPSWDWTPTSRCDPIAIGGQPGEGLTRP